MVKTSIITPPKTETELLQRANKLAGCCLGEIAQQLQLAIPDDLTHQKGWVGILLEKSLGATANSKAEPDFQLISVELKTLPLNHKLLAKESTFVCTVPQRITLTWRNSQVWQKLKRILWIPVEATKNIPIRKRRIGHPILWTPNQAQEAILRQDWHELTEMLSLGQHAQLTAKQGTYLQCRPKAAHSRIVRNEINQQGKPHFIIPRGFYLRTCLTNEILHGLHRNC